MTDADVRAVLRAVRAAGYGAMLDLDDAHALLLPVELRHDRVSDRYPSERWYQLLAELAPVDPVRATAEVWAQGFAPSPTLYIEGSGQGSPRLATRLQRWLLENTVAAPAHLSVKVEAGGRALRLSLSYQYGEERRMRLRGTARRGELSHGPRAVSALAAGLLAKEVRGVRERLDLLLRHGVEVPESVVAEVVVMLTRAGNATSTVAQCHRYPELVERDDAWSGAGLPTLEDASRTSRAMLFEPSAISRQF